MDANQNLTPEETRTIRSLFSLLSEQEYLFDHDKDQSSELLKKTAIFARALAALTTMIEQHHPWRDLARKTIDFWIFKKEDKGLTRDQWMAEFETLNILDQEGNKWCFSYHKGVWEKLVGRDWVAADPFPAKPTSIF